MGKRISDPTLIRAAPATRRSAPLDRYVGEYKAASGFTATFRRDGATLFVKPGTNPEAPLIARSETRFQDPRGPFFDFQLDGQGKVTAPFWSRMRSAFRWSGSSATIVTATPGASDIMRATEIGRPCVGDA